MKAKFNKESERKALAVEYIDSVCGTALYRSLSENEIKSLIYGFLDCFSHLGDYEGRNLDTCVATTNEIVAYAKMKFWKTE